MCATTMPENTPYLGGVWVSLSKHVRIHEYEIGGWVSVTTSHVSGEKESLKRDKALATTPCIKGRKRKLETTRYVGGTKKEASAKTPCTGGK